MITVFVAIACASGLAWPHTIDDAFILLRYAQSIASGTGYAFNPGSPSDGVTGPLWLLAPLAAIAAELNPLFVAKGVGALCACATAALTVRWAGARAQGALLAWTSACVLACLPDVATWAVAGLETPLAMLMLSTLAWSGLDRVRRPAVAGLATAALAWLRPELAPCVAVLWIALLTPSALSFTHTRARARKPQIALGIALAVAGIAALFAFRLAMFGDALPLSARAKPADLVLGVRYTATSAALMTSLVGVALAVLGARAGRRAERFMAAALLAHLVAVAIAGGDWMPGGRLFVPVAPLYALLVARGVARVASRRVRGTRWAMLALALTCSVPLIDLATRIPELRASGERRLAQGPALASFLRARASSVALLDAGYLAYASGLPVVDLGGLTDPYVARLPGGHIDKRIDEAYLRARAPDALVLHSERLPRADQDGRLLAISGYPVEMRIARMPWVIDRFRVARVVQYAPRYWYVVLLSHRAP